LKQSRPLELNIILKGEMAQSTLFGLSVKILKISKGDIQNSKWLNAFDSTIANTHQPLAWVNQKIKVLFWAG